MIGPRTGHGARDIANAQSPRVAAVGQKYSRINAQNGK
jgi:hypothetical protein